LFRIQIDDEFKKLISFFIITFIISWSIWCIAPLIFYGDLPSMIYFCSIGGFGPSLAALILASRGKSDRINHSKKKEWMTFIIIYILGLISGFVALSNYPNFTVITIIIIFILSFIPAFLISGMYSANSGISILLQTMKGIKKKNLYLFFAFIIPFMVNIGAVIFYIILGGYIPPTTNIFLLFILLTASFPFSIVFGGPVSEEIGWRGYATPRLIDKYSPLTTGLIIGVIWALWHAPLHFNGIYGDGLLGFLLRFTYNIPFGIIFTWYFLKSHGNLLGAIILHASVNVYASLVMFSLDVNVYSTIIYIIFTIIIIIHGKMWKSLPITEKFIFQQTVS